MSSMIAWMLATLGPLWWMWIVTPFFAAFVYILAAKDDPRRMRELDRWRKAFGPHQLDLVGGYREKPKATATTVATPPPAVSALPSLLSRALRTFAGGEVLAHYELVPKLAYVSIVGSNSEQSSDFQAVLGKLENKKGPAFTIHPIPIVEGVPQANTGIPFPKDAEFTELFVIEPIIDVGGRSDVPASPAALKAIRKWLSQPIRDALKEVPEAFVRVEGQTMLVAYFGDASSEAMNQLILAADTLFAEHGAGGGASLFGDAEDDEEEDEMVGEAEPKEA
jgi:hypothetical protein